MIRPAQRSQAKPLIGFYAESGGGKTHSALLMARGFVGPTGRICMIETEQGRGEAFVDMIPGGYDVRPMRDDFSPKLYNEALREVEGGGYDALIIDSASHEWEAQGGVLDMAEKARAGGAKGVLVWQQPKMQHARQFMLPLLQTAIPLVIVCMRARYPMVRDVSKRGTEGEWKRSERLEPKQSDDILFELFVHGWFDAAEHKFHATRYGRPDLATVIKDNEVIDITTGERLAQWAKQAPSPAEAAPSPRLHEEARAAAALGRVELRAWWRTLNAASRVVLQAEIDELGRLADEADKQHSPRAEDAQEDRLGE